MSTDDTRQSDRARSTAPGHAPSCLQEAHEEMLQLPVIGVSVSTMVGATLIYSATGALGIDDTIPPVQRLLFGGLCAMMCWPISHSMMSTVLRFVRHMRTYQILMVWAASILFIAMPCAAVGYAIIGLFGLNDVLLAKVYLHFGIGLAACSAVLMYAVCLRARLRHTAGATLSDVEADVPAAKAADATGSEDGSGSVASRDGDTGDERSKATSHAATQQPARFLDRLPEKLGRDVIYLNVSGHYVNAVTTEGSGVILMRFADAVAELGDAGIQVHRSYWVGYRHITGIFRRDERTMVRVTGGHELPVSRTYLAAVRALDSSERNRGRQPGLPRPSAASD